MIIYQGMLPILFLSSICTVYIRTISQVSRSPMVKKKIVFFLIQHFPKIFNNGTFVDSIPIISFRLLVVFGILEMLNLTGLCVLLFSSGLINIIKQHNQIMPKGQLEELQLFTVRRENLREGVAIFKYLKIPIEEELKVLSLKPENKRKNQGRQADFDFSKGNFLIIRTFKGK